MMAEYENGKWERNLPFPLQDAEYSEFSENNAGMVTKTTPDFFNPDEPDEILDIHFRMSMSQFTAIASAIDIGRDIGYGERSFELWRTWCKALIGEIMVNCEEVADCVESEIAGGNTTLINALTNNAISTGTGGNYNRVNGDITTVLDRNEPLALQQDEIKELENCNLDELWGGIRHGIVERLDDTARDLLEDLAAINDLPQRFQAFIDVIPVLGDIAEGIVTLATEVIPDILNLYNSYSSEAQLDEIACDLFGLVCAECRYPTFEELYNYYSTLGYEMDAMDAQTMSGMMGKISTMVGNLQPASIVYHSMITFQLFTLYLQAQWNGNAGTRAIERFAAIGEDFGSNNWLDLCDTCIEPYQRYTWDFKESNQDSYVTQNFAAQGGAWIAGKGWGMTAISGSAAYLSLGISLEPTWKIRAVGIKLNQASGTNNLGSTLRPTRGIATGQVNQSLAWGTTGWTFFANGLASITNMREFALGMNYAPSVNAIVEAVTIIFEAGFAKEGSVPTASQNLSGTVYP